MKDGDYEPGAGVTPERLTASLLAVLWIVIAYHEFGLRKAAGLGFLLLMLLAMIWFPELMARLKSQGQHLDSGANGPVSPISVRIVAWSILLGLPAAWFLFSRVFNT